MHRPHAYADRTPPHDPHAEMAVLGSVLIDQNMVDEVGQIIAAEDFHVDACRHLWSIILEQHDQGKPFDLLTIKGPFIARTGLPGNEAVGTLAEIAHSTPIGCYAVYYAEIVRRDSQRRAIILAAEVAMHDAYDQRQQPEAIASAAQTALDAAIERMQPAPLENAREAIADVIEEAQRIATTSTRAGLSTGLSAFDSELGGLHKSELAILAARPRMGKSALMGQIVRWNVQHGRFAYVVSLEMSKTELVWRMLCAEAGVDANTKRTGRLTQGDVDALTAAAERFADAHFLIDDRPSLTLADITRMARRLKRSHNLALIAIDYLQLIEVEDRRLERNQAVGATSRGLKRLARTLDAPILCLAQLNRDVEAGKDPRPKLSHLRESGAIEQDADVVAFIHRAEVYKPDDPDLKGKAELIVEKNRSGPTASFALHWHGPTMTFTESPSAYSEFGEFQ